MELDSLRGQHLYAALLSVHENDGIRHLQQTKISVVTMSPRGNIPTVADGPLRPLTLHAGVSSPTLHLQSALVEHFSSLQDAAAAGHRVLNDQTCVPLTEGALHQTLGS